MPQVNGKYVLPEDASPEWRALYEAGEDMILLEYMVFLTPSQRILFHNQLRDHILATRAGSAYAKDYDPKFQSVWPF